MKSNRKYHDERSSPFFRLRSKDKLAALLFSSVGRLTTISSEKNLYFDFQKKKESGGFRKISARRSDLKELQSRIASLLQRITPPDYLFAPVAGRSYVDNAARHIGAEAIHLLDIEDFFPSCTANKVVWFFIKRMECSPDVAAILRGIVTKDGCLPQGSPCSPILAYLCYVDMWSSVSDIAESAGCTLSVYADDLTISGRTVPEKAIWDIKKTLFRHGHKYKITKERSKYNKSAEITGVILNKNCLLAPNRQNKSLHMIKKNMRNETRLEIQLKLGAQMRGRAAQIKQITGKNKATTI